jgi:hypothetical protein
MASAAVEKGVYEEMMRVVKACAVRIWWHLRPLSKRVYSTVGAPQGSWSGLIDVFAMCS